MKKIVHYISLDTIGGVETLFGDLIENSSDKLIKHHVVLYSGKIHPYINRAITGKVASVHRIKYLSYIKLPKKPPLIRIWNNQRILRLLQPDAVICWNSMSHNDYFRNVSYERDSRLVFYDHGTSWYSKKSSETGVFLSRLEMTLCCSFASKRVLELYHGHTGSKMVILNPLRPGLQSSIAPPKSLPTGRPLRLGTAGRLVNVKGFGIAIHALAQLKSRGIEAELHIAGTGKLQQTLQGLSKELDVARQTQFHGLVKNMFLFFRDIDIFLCPSIREPFGLVAVEAMGCGCPVICSSVDGLPEIVTHGNTGLCISPTIPINEYTGFGGGVKGIPEFIYNPENDSIEEPRIVDPEKIADSVETIISDKHHFSAMSVASIEDAKRRFNFRNYLEAVSDILERI